MDIDKQKAVEWLKANTNYEVLSHRATEAFTGWSTKDPQVYFNKMREVIDILDEVVNLVEKFAKEVNNLSSQDKLDAAVSFIDGLVKFNFFLEFFDGVVIKMLLTTIVEQKNKWFGKDWFKVQG